MDRFGGAGNEWVPIGEGFSLRDEAIGASFREPALRFWQAFGGEDNTTFDHHFAQAVIHAAAGRVIEQTAGNVGVGQLAVILVFEFEQTAFTAAIAKTFPLVFAHVGEGYRLPIFFIH